MFPFKTLCHFFNNLGYMLARCHAAFFCRYFVRLLSIPLAALPLDGDELQARETGTSEIKKEIGTAIGQWWQGPYATGDWFGGRTFLEDHGLKLSGSSTSIYYGVPTNDLRHNSVFCYNLTLIAEFDFGKMLGLQGLKGSAGIQWETGESFRDGTGASVAFSPSAFSGWWKWRLRPIVLTYTTPELFGIKEFFTLSGGWQSPTSAFIIQTTANLFQNYAFWGGPLVANNVWFDGNFVSWGGYMKIKPAEWAYVQGGLWAAVPNALDWRNRGIYFALPSRNGLFFMGETGVTPEFSPKRLPGKYAFGAYYWGLSCQSVSGKSYPGKFGFYWQADQMLYREPSASPHISAAEQELLSSSGGKTSSPILSKEKLSPQGLYAFTLITYAPKYNNALPFFLRTGLVYKGLIPTRDQDDIGIGFAYGNYNYRFLVDSEKNKHVRRTNEALLEVDYRLQINRWLYTQPFLEYIIRPQGTGQFKDAIVLGIATKVTF